jgi:hypothetical protein
MRVHRDRITRVDHARPLHVVVVVVETGDLEHLRLVRSSLDVESPHARRPPSHDALRGVSQERPGLVMTHQGAIDTGQSLANRVGKACVVYRLPLWPVDCYGVIAVDRLLPMEAITFECLQPAGASSTVATTPDDTQGSLF